METSEEEAMERRN